MAHLDVLGCILATMAAWAATALPPGELVRVLLTLPVILFVPGYLALQAVVGMPRERDQRRQAMAALGLSPAIVGLVALATALAPGGFKLVVIANAILATCILLAAGAVARRIVVADRTSKQRVFAAGAVTEHGPARPLTEGSARRATDRQQGAPAGTYGAYGAQAGTTGDTAVPPQGTQGGVQFIAIRPARPATQASNLDVPDPNAGVNRQAQDA